MEFPEDEKYHILLSLCYKGKRFAGDKYLLEVPGIL
jgi:hypothetical protein